MSDYLVKTSRDFKTWTTSFARSVVAGAESYHISGRSADPGGKVILEDVTLMKNRLYVRIYRKSI